jgi:hypothetical protein
MAPQASVRALIRQIEDDRGTRKVEQLLLFGSPMPNGNNIVFSMPLRL